MSVKTSSTSSTRSSSRRALDFAGRSIGPLRLARAMTLNIMGGSCILMALAVLWPTAAVTAIFLREHLGASKTLVGLNLTLITLATVASLPGAWLFSQLRRRRRVWITLTALARMFMFGPALVVLLVDDGANHSLLIAVFMGCLFLVQTGSAFTSPGWWSWMADLIPESIWGAFYGRRYRWILLAQSAATIASGLLIDWAKTPEMMRYLFFAIFAGAAVLAVVDPLLFAAVPEPVRPKPERQNLSEVLVAYLEPIRDRGFLIVLLAGGAYMFFYNLPLIFLILFLRGEDANGIWIGGHASLGLLSLVTVVFAVATGLTAPLWGRLADKIGHRIVWILGSVGYCTYASYFFINADNYAWLSVATAAAFGALFAGQPVAVQNLALSMAPPRRREYYMSMYLAVVAVGSSLSPIMAGWLADDFRVMPNLILPSGQPACYIHLLLGIAFVGMLLTLPFMIWVPDPRGIPFRPWFGRLISGDLLRVAWNISVLGSASSPPRQVRALRRISARDGNVMLAEIIRALDDSEPGIRREALLALGRIGTPEALDLLRWYLFEPDAITRAVSVEAIAQTAVSDRIGLLERALHDPDSRVRRVAVEALGRARDDQAGEALCKLLAAESDGEVLACVAVALSRGKRFGAVREMLELALHADNATVRGQMLIALADLLGSAGRFHKLWRKDRYWRGSAFATLIRKFRRQGKLLKRTGHEHARLSRTARREYLERITAHIEPFLEMVEEEDWTEALAELRIMAFEFLRRQYGYQGDDGSALEFISAVAPGQAHRYWLINYLEHASKHHTAPEAPWDGLTLLGLYVLVHGHPSG